MARTDHGSRMGRVRELVVDLDAVDRERRAAAATPCRVRVAIVVVRVSLAAGCLDAQLDLPRVTLGAAALESPFELLACGTKGGRVRRACHGGTERGRVRRACHGGTKRGRLRKACHGGGKKRWTTRRFKVHCTRLVLMLGEGGDAGGRAREPREKRHVARLVPAAWHHRVRRPCDVAKGR